VAWRKAWSEKPLGVSAHLYRGGGKAESGEIKAGAQRSCYHVAENGKTKYENGGENRRKISKMWRRNGGGEGGNNESVMAAKANHHRNGESASMRRSASGVINNVAYQRRKLNV